MSSVVVLAPNGRRQTVKCTPNTTILQVLEEVCKKQGIKADDFDIKHHNKVLDTTTTIRFSGLPNNAQLELCEIVKLRLESEVTLAVNLEDGSRLIGNFKPSETLLQILLKLCPHNVTQEKPPVVIYTRREIYGDDLEKTTLKSLGITGGRAMVRLMNKSPEELKVQANVSAPLPTKVVEEKPFRSRSLQINVCQSSEEKPSENSPNISEMDVDVEEPEPKTKKLETKPKVDLIQMAKERKQADKKSESLKNGEKAQKLCNCTKNDASNANCNGTCADHCSDNPKSSENDNGIEEQFIFLGSRNAMLFSLETAIAVPSEELPDDFYDLTLEDARKILRDVKRKRFEMENNPLQTAALRNLEESKKQLRLLNRYKKAVIRVQFPNRTVLQGTFNPSDTVETVLDFVREFLEDKQLDFYIYCAPPKAILDKCSKLLDIGCVPGALLHFGTTGGLAQDEYLREDLRNKFTTSSMASLAASKIRNENMRSICSNMVEYDDFDMDSTETPSVNVGASTSAGVTHENYERKIVSSTENVPKWFKPSK